MEDGQNNIGTDAHTHILTNAGELSQLKRIKRTTYKGRENNN